MRGEAHADAFANPLLPQDAAAAVKLADEPGPGELADAAEASDRMPGGMEATPGVAPEIATHDSKSFASLSEMSPEEQAVQGLEHTGSGGQPDDEADVAAAAEGRTVAPEPDDAV